jgi:hypothetical protein
MSRNDFSAEGKNSAFVAVTTDLLIFIGVINKNTFTCANIFFGNFITVIGHKAFSATGEKKRFK